MDFEKIFKAKAEMTPEPGEGFNLVGIDEYEEPGDELYLIGNYPTRKQAEAAQKKRSSDERTVIYGED